MESSERPAELQATPALQGEAAAAYEKRKPAARLAGRYRRPRCCLGEALLVVLAAAVRMKGEALRRLEHRYRGQ